MYQRQKAGRVYINTMDLCFSLLSKGDTPNPACLIFISNAVASFKITAGHLKKKKKVSRYDSL